MTIPMNSNPSVDEVLRILTEEMEVGSRLPISEDGRDFLSKYRRSFEDHLQNPDNWRRESGAVRHAARQLGVIACAIASLHRAVEVTAANIDVAARVVEQHCAIGGVGHLGRWCGRDPEPEPGT